MTDISKVAFTLDEAAVATGIPADTLQQFVQSGELPTVKLGGTRVIRIASLDKLLAKYEGNPHGRLGTFI